MASFWSDLGFWALRSLIAGVSIGILVGASILTLFLVLSPMDEQLRRTRRDEGSRNT